MVSDEAKCSLKKKGTISNEHPLLDEQPEHIVNVMLHRYQLQTIYAMQQLETGTTSLNSEEHITSEIGILANKVGSGKSLCVLGRISQEITLPF